MISRTEIADIGLSKFKQKETYPHWFYPAMMILLGAHYCPFVFLYGMRMFAVLASLIAGGGLVIAMYWSSSFNIGAWYAGVVLLLFAVVGRTITRREAREFQGSITT